MASSLVPLQNITRSDHLRTLIAQKRLRDLKSLISAQSKKNFVLERDVRYLDSRIALLIQNRMGGEESKIAEALDEGEAEHVPYPDEKRMAVSDLPAISTTLLRSSTP